MNRKYLFTIVAFLSILLTGCTTEHSSKDQTTKSNSTQITKSRESDPQFEAFTTAVEEGDSATVARMLKADKTLIKACESGRNNRTALHFAAAAGQAKTTKLLIQYGADVNAHNKADGFTPLHYAATEGYVDIAKLLINSGADIEAVDNVNQTPLAEACSSSMDDAAHIEFVKLLLSKGANVNGDDKAACTPLQLAGDGKIAEILRKHGATQ